MCSAHYRRWVDGKSLDTPLRKPRKRYAGQTCEVDGCESAAKSLNLCEAHYARLRLHGDPLHGGEVHRANRTVEERFWAKVAKTETCWNWTAATNQYGYGVFRGDGRNWLAHRFSFENKRGQVPPGLQVDHRCHNIKCVNPDHLRAVTNKQNQENLSGPRSAASGIRGIYYNKKTNKWYGQVAHNGACHNVGSFANIEDAEAAVIAKRNELFTHNDLDRSA